MKQRVGRVFLGAFILFILTAATIGALSVYSSSEPVKNRITSELKSVLKMPVSLRKTGFTLWDGLVLEGVRITESEDNTSSAFLETEKIRVVIPLLPLLRNEIVLQEIIVSNAKVTGKEGADGGLILPRLKTLTANPPRLVEEGQKEKHVRPSTSASRVTLGRLRVEKAHITLNDAQGQPRLELEGVGVRAALRSEGVATGMLQVDRLQFLGLPPFSFLQSPFNYTSDGLELTDLSGRLAGGTLTGSASIATEQPYAFRAKIKLMGVDLEQFQSKERGEIGGRLMMELDVRGQAANPESLRGRGMAEINQGRLASTPWLQTLGILFEVPELVNIEVTQASTQFRLKGRDVRIESLSMDSENLRLTCIGSLKNFERLSLEARLHVSPTLRERLPTEIARSFVEPGQGDWTCLDFDVDGTLRSPKTNLQKKLLRGATKGVVGSLLNDLLGKESDKVREPANPQPAPATPTLPLDLMPSPTPPHGESKAP